MELFTAFLWLAEFVIVFVSILLIFFLNVYANSNKINKTVFSLKYLGLFFLLLVSNHYLLFFSELEFFNSSSLNSYWFYENYYNLLGLNLLNDFVGLYFSFYSINSFELVVFGWLLVYGSMVAVNLNFLNRNNKSNFYFDFFQLFDFFKDFSKFIFMRKQDLVTQGNTVAATRIFKKKIGVINIKPYPKPDDIFFE
jgi:hypothetical protein